MLIFDEFNAKGGMNTFDHCHRHVGLGSNPLIGFDQLDYTGCNFCAFGHYEGDNAHNIMELDPPCSVFASLLDHSNIILIMLMHYNGLKIL